MVEQQVEALRVEVPKASSPTIHKRPGGGTGRRSGFKTRKVGVRAPLLGTSDKEGWHQCFSSLLLNDYPIANGASV